MSTIPNPVTVWPGQSSTAARQLVVIERGAAQLELEPASAYEQTVTLAQPRGEQSAEFGERVLRRIASVERMGRAFGAAALSAATSTDVEVLAVRRSIALGIRAHGMSTGKLTRLLLVAAPQCGGPAQDALLALADELLQSPGERNLVLSVRFGPAPQREDA